MAKKEILKSFSVIAVIAILSKMLGFLRDATISYFYGASAITDAFNIVQFLPNFLFMVIHQAIVVGFIPVFLKIRNSEGKDRANGFAQYTILIFTLVSSFFCFALFFFPSFFVKIFAGGFTGESASLAVTMLKYTAWSLMLQSIVGVFSAYLNALKKFIVPACLGFVLDVSVISCLVFSKNLNNPALLGFAPLLTMVLEAIFVFVFAYKNGFRFSRCFRNQKKNFTGMLVLAIPSIISLGISQLNYYVDKNISSNYLAGSISALSLSNNIVNALETIIVSTLATVLYTEFSNLASEGKREEASILISNTFNKLMLVLIPTSILFFVCSEPIVRILYGHGSFTESSVQLTSACLKSYAIGMPFLGVSAIITRYFYSIKKAKYVVFASICGLITNALGDVIVWKTTSFGVEGLAAVTSVSFMVNCILLIILLKKVNKNLIIGFQSYLVFYGLSFISGAISSIFVALGGKVAFGILSALGCGISFTVVYAILVLVYFKKTNIYLYNDMISKIKSLFDKKRKKSKQNK